MVKMVKKKPEIMALNKTRELLLQCDIFSRKNVNTASDHYFATLLCLSGSDSEFSVYVARIVPTNHSN